MVRLHAWSGTSSDGMAAYPSQHVLDERWENPYQNTQ
jgi:hypothetical protein